MDWFYLEDAHYLSDEKFVKGKLLFPSYEEVKKALREQRNVDVVASYLPPDDLKPLFNIIEKQNLYGILSSQNEKYLQNIPTEFREKARMQLVENKLGLRMFKPGKIEMKGLSNIKRYIYSIKNIKDEKLKAKAIFLVGIPGTGKSLSAKYAASLLDGYLVEFNLSKIMESNNPIFTLHSIFKFLESRSMDTSDFYILWIDEIEKMFVGEEKEKRIFGQLLTILNDFNTPTGYKINGVFWVTANNIQAIMERNPEFLRKGRFDELFFVDTPFDDTTAEMIEMYADYYGAKYSPVIRPGRLGEHFVHFVKTHIYPKQTQTHGAKVAERFIYTPAEISQVGKELAIRGKINDEFKATNDVSLIQYLYPHKVITQVLGVTELLLKTNPEYKNKSDLHDMELEGMIKLHQDFLKKSKGNVTELDLITICFMMFPLQISMAEAIANIRSQEALFVPAD